MSALAPGTWVATVRGVPNTTIIADDAGDYATITRIDGWWSHEDVHIIDARPLIVLDLGTLAPSVVTNVLHDAGYLGLADQVEAQTKPRPQPRPTPLALVSLIRGADTAEWGERLLKMWLAQDSEATS